MNIPASSQPLYTFQNRAGEFVDVLARAEYSGSTIDLTTKTVNGRTSYTVEGTDIRTTVHDSVGQALREFREYRLVTLAKKFGTFEIAK